MLNLDGSRTDAKLEAYQPSGEFCRKIHDSRIWEQVKADVCAPSRRRSRSCSRRSTP
jgi:hypothetical protein